MMGSYYFATETLEISVARDVEPGLCSALVSEIDVLTSPTNWRHWEGLGPSPQKAIKNAVQIRAKDIGDDGHTSTRDLASALAYVHDLIFGFDDPPSPPPSTSATNEPPRDGVGG